MGRKRYCGRWTLQFQEGGDGPRRIVRLDCKTWDCAYCGPIKAGRVKRAIRDIALRMNLRRFLTLTLDPARIQGDPVPYLRQTFSKLRVYLRNRYGKAITYIAILEFQKNGNPHLHVLLDRYIERSWIAGAWQAVGGGRMVDIRCVDLHRVSRYLAKYLTKELLLSAPKRSRRVTSSQSIRLFDKREPDSAWTLRRISIFVLFESEGRLGSGFEWDQEGILKAMNLETVAVA